MRKLLLYLLAFSLLAGILPTPLETAAGTPPDTADTGNAPVVDVDPIQQALGEENAKAKNLPAAFHKKS